MNYSAIGIACLAVILLLANPSHQKTNTTKMIVEIARHGVRTPFEDDIVQPWMQNAGKGRLTPVGVRQHFALGREMKERFPSIFNSDLKLSEVRLTSTQIQRTIVSSISHLTGAMRDFKYPNLVVEKTDSKLMPAGVPVDVSTVNFSTPLPEGVLLPAVFSTPKDQDTMLFPFTEQNCPSIHRIKAENVAKLKTELFASEGFQTQMKILTEKLGAHPEKFHDKFEYAEYLSDFVMMDHRNNPDPLIPPTDPIFLPACRAGKVACTYQYLDLRVRKVAISGVVMDLLDHIKRKANTTSNQLKYVYYSTHDTMLAPFLMSLGVIDGRCYFDDLKAGKYSPECGEFPDTAANMVFELIEEKDDDGSSQHHVKFYYNLKPVKICRESAREVCLLGDFDRLMNSIIEPDYQAICAGKPSPAHEAKNSAIWWQVAGISLLVVFVLEFVAIAYCCLRKSKESGHHKKRSDNSEYVQVDEVIGREE